MTRIWAISDFQGDINLHRPSFEPKEIPEADVLVVAGDFHPPLRNSVKALLEVAKNIPVVYVPGNRDFYSADCMADELAAARELAEASLGEGRGVHLLDDQSVVIAGTRFVGATLWSDLKLSGGPLPGAHLHLMDFHIIRTDAGILTQDDYASRHAASRAFIEATLAQPFDGPTVVVSHHAPHGGSIGERYRANERGANAFFASDLSDVLFSETAPELWIHGATHVGTDYRVGRTRVVSNPLGYATRNENPRFDQRMVLEPSARAA